MVAIRYQQNDRRRLCKTMQTIGKHAHGCRFSDAGSLMAFKEEERVCLKNLQVFKLSVQWQLRIQWMAINPLIQSMRKATDYEVRSIRPNN